MSREILHVDMNNFFASVECLYAPELKKVPMAVAGSPEKRHGIVLAKNMLAKEKGVKTAEPLWAAERKCPGIVFVPPHFERYEKYSQAAMAIYMEYTDQVESFGIDESWLDVTGSRRLFGTGREIAEALRRRIREELGLTVSVGVSFNKTFAKLGSDYKKPDAVTEITPENFKTLLWPMAMDALLFVGPATKKTLEKFGLHTIGEVATCERSFLASVLGKGGAQLWDTANGLDKSPVALVGEERDVKSIGNSTTTPQDLVTVAEVKNTLYELAESVATRLRKQNLRARGVQLSIRRGNLESYQRSCTLEFPVADSKSLFTAAFQLYSKSRETAPIRSLGIRAERLCDDSEEQLSLFGEETHSRRIEQLESTMDKIQLRYGKEALSHFRKG